MDQNLDTIPSREVLYNERNLMIAREIDQLNDKDSLYNGLTEDMQNEILNTEKVHEIIESFTDLKLEEDGLMKLGNVYAKKEKVEETLSYIDMPSYGRQTGLCLDIEDIMYSQGIYTVTFIYCYPQYAPSHRAYEEGVEDLPVYEMTIGLTINEDQKYSKYHVSTWMEPQLIKEGKVEVSEEETNTEGDENEKDLIIDESIKKFVGVWNRTYNVDHEESGDYMLAIQSDGTFLEEQLSKITNEGTYEIVQENGWDKIILNYSTGEQHEILYVSAQECKLHYSDGQQVFEKAEIITTFSIFANE